jgi:hypothetical protein
MKYWTAHPGSLAKLYCKGCGGECHSLIEILQTHLSRDFRKPLRPSVRIAGVLAVLAAPIKLDARSTHTNAQARMQYALSRNERAERKCF